MSRHEAKIYLWLATAALFTARVVLAGHAKTVNIYTEATLPSGQPLKSGKDQVTVEPSK